MSGYIFPDELRKAYESMTMPLAFYEEGENGAFIPLLVTDGFCEMMELDHEQLIDHLKGSAFEKVHPDDIGKLLQAVTGFVNRTGGYDVIYRSKYMLRDEYHYVHCKGVRQIMPDGTELMVVSYLDLSTCVDETEKLTQDYMLFKEDHFYSDPLTGLPNQNYLTKFADEWVNTLHIHGKTPALIFTDVIAMQSYNNQYGYEKGNELLIQIAEKLKASFPDALVLRGTNDHFIVIDAFDSQKEINDRVITTDNAIRQEAEGNTPGIKAGACVYEKGMKSVEALDHARNAMKWLGNDLNRVCHFYSHLAEDAIWNQQYIIENFDKALTMGWIKIYYQGIARIETGKGAALEALARWIDPVRGILSPKEFIPVLKKYHLMHKLDLFMAEQVCREIIIRKENGLPLIPVSVNFSAQDFDYEDIPARLNEIYDHYCPDLSPDMKYLIIEITEQDIAKATDRFHEQLRKLRKNGFHLWLDDFGSGYSSLNVLGHYDVDLIKFDMDLLKNLQDHNGANRRIMKAMTELAKELGIRTLAEGMETDEQRLFLHEIGCELAQGYLFHRPEPLDAILYRIKSRQKVRPCETAEERTEFNSKWSQNMSWNSKDKP
jgi:diguanylate cyclase (GGDEF)-like protein